MLVFAMGAFSEMPVDVSRICDITAHELARIHVSYYNDDAKRTKDMYKQRIQRARGHTAHRGWARLLLDRTRDIITHGPAHRGARQRSDERRKQEESMLNVRPRPFGCARLWMILSDRSTQRGCATCCSSMGSGLRKGEHQHGAPNLRFKSTAARSQSAAEG